MSTPPLAHLIKMPAKPYVPAVATDIRKTLDAERARLAALAEPRIVLNNPRLSFVQLVKRGA